MISLSQVVWVVVYLLVGGMIFWLLSLAVEKLNPPEPWKKVATVVLYLLAVLVLIGILMSLVGGGPLFRW